MLLEELQPIMSANRNRARGENMKSAVQKMKLRELVLWLEKNHVVRSSHDYEVTRNGNGWEQMHCEDCRFCRWEQIKDEILNG